MSGANADISKEYRPLENTVLQRHLQPTIVFTTEHKHTHLLSKTEIPLEVNDQLRSVSLIETYMSRYKSIYVHVLKNLP